MHHPLGANSVIGQLHARPKRRARVQAAEIPRPRACAQDAARQQLRPLPHACAGTQDGPLQHSLRPHARSGEHTCAPQLRTGRNDRIPSDIAVRRDLRSLRTRATIGRLNACPATEQIALRAQQRRRIAHIAPVRPGRIAIQRHALLQHQRKQLAPKIKGSVPGNQRQRLALQQVHAGIDLAADHTAPIWLFNKAQDAPALIRHHHAVGQGDIHAFEHQGGCRAHALVKAQRVAQIAARQSVARQHQHGIRIALQRVQHAARRAQGRFFLAVTQRHPMPALSKGAFDILRAIAQRGRGMIIAIPGKQTQGVIHHGRAAQRHQGLGAIARHGAQPHARAAGHNHRLHRHNKKRLRLFNRKRYYVRARRRLCLKNQGFCQLSASAAYRRISAQVPSCLRLKPRSVPSNCKPHFCITRPEAGLSASWRICTR